MSDLIHLRVVWPVAVLREKIIWFYQLAATQKQRCYFPSIQWILFCPSSGVCWTLWISWIPRKKMGLWAKSLMTQRKGRAFEWGEEEFPSLVAVSDYISSRGLTQRHLYPGSDWRWWIILHAGIVALLRKSPHLRLTLYAAGLIFCPPEGRPVPSSCFRLYTLAI